MSWLVLTLAWAPTLARAQVSSMNKPRPGTTSNNFENTPPEASQADGTLQIPGALLAKAWLWGGTGVPVPSTFPHSGARVVSPCQVPRGHCVDTTMVVTFDSLQRMVWLWVGALQNRGSPVVRLTAYSRAGVMLARSQVALDTTSPHRVRTAIRVATDTNAIAIVQIIVSGVVPTFAIDDLNFHRDLPVLPESSAVAVESTPATVPGESTAPVVPAESIAAAAPVESTHAVPESVLVIPMQNVTPPVHRGWPKWLIIPAAILLGLLAWLILRAPTPPTDDTPPRPLPRVTAHLASNGLAEQQVTFTETDPLDIALTYTLDVQSTHSITFPDDPPPPPGAP